MAYYKARDKLNAVNVEDLYYKENLSMMDIAKTVGVSYKAVNNYFKLHGIKIKGRRERQQTDKAQHKGKAWNKGIQWSDEVKNKISEANYKGGIGYKKKRNDGYILIHFPDHPKSQKDGMIMEHILVMESILGRHLNDDEVVHHINHIRDDNRASNLKLMTRKEHMSFHMQDRRANGEFVGRTIPVINLDTGEIFNSVKEAAEKYNIASTCITRACKHNKKSCNYRWAYYKKDEVEK